MLEAMVTWLSWTHGDSVAIETWLHDHLSDLKASSGFHFHQISHFND